MADEGYEQYDGGDGGMNQEEDMLMQDDGGVGGEEYVDNQDQGDYQQHWGSSDENNGGQAPEGEEEDEDEIPFVDDLPIFANQESKALHEETKVLEKKRDQAEKVSQVVCRRVSRRTRSACAGSRCRI